MNARRPFRVFRWGTLPVLVVLLALASMNLVSAQSDHDNFGNDSPDNSNTMFLPLVKAAELAGTVVATNHSPDPDAHLKAVGPVSPEHGFPVWYRDAHITLELCLDNDLNCLLPFPPPYSFPTHFPDEAFYFSAASFIPTGVGANTADIGLDLEAAFVNGPVASGDQMVFGRIRIRMDNLQAGADYAVTHPYGQDVVTAEADGTVFVTEDIGNMIGGPNFGEALNSRIGPFLTWDTFPTDAAIPPGYIGDVNLAHAVTGSPFGTNFFRVEGPAGSFPASPNQCADPLLGNDPAVRDDCIEIGEFFVMGKLSTTAGVQPTLATYARGRQGQNVVGAIDVLALSQADQVIHVDAATVSQTSMRGDAGGHYHARVNFNDTGAPPELTVTNAGDVPPTVARITPVDQVVVTQAAFDGDTQTLSVDAVSSDQFAPPTLTAYREDGTTVLGLIPLSLGGIVAPPARVVVKSSAGGEDSEPVQISGAAFPAVLMVALAGPDQGVPQGATVTLDGSNSSGDIATYAWTQTSGPSVALNNANAVAATFTAGAAGSVYTFNLTVDDNPDVQPASTDEVVITVEEVTPPVANAGPDQGPSQAVVQGAKITLDGSASTGATDYHWGQISGTPVTSLTGVDHSSTASFVLTDDNPVTFQLDVTGPGGSASDTVLITPLQDTLVVISAKYTRSKTQWDIRGTATVFGPLGNSVSVYLGNVVDPTKLIAGNLAVDTTGAWRFRGAPATVGGRVPSTTNSPIITVVSSRGGGPTQFTGQATN